MSPQKSVARHFIFNACVTEDIHTSALFEPPIMGYENEQFRPQEHYESEDTRHVHALSIKDTNKPNYVTTPTVLK